MLSTNILNANLSESPNVCPQDQIHTGWVCLPARAAEDHHQGVDDLQSSKQTISLLALKVHLLQDS